ncbi:hypothetical protein CAPTEDRAFT_217715 [Capitella teleta]|uniref:Uncharacterized protein n=1 Tax=Capitella teleta TaxID=283909 RepID=X2AMK6_CAPTE|nr:hypothetical protein CAPTEDRAFT_217715 [Capitella teleta]|eukprot:ELU00330.1 hypothetical protein CAPTEDRAFT_217715 [Capitella teleta]
MADTNYEDNVVANGQAEGEVTANYENVTLNQEEVVDERPSEEVEQPVEQVEEPPQVEETPQVEEETPQAEEQDLPPPPPEVEAYSSPVQDDVLLPPPAAVPEPDVASDNGQDAEADDRPVIELFVKGCTGGLGGKIRCSAHVEHFRLAFTIDGSASQLFHSVHVDMTDMEQVKNLRLQALWNDKTTTMKHTTVRETQIIVLDSPKMIVHLNDDKLFF